MDLTELERLVALVQGANIRELSLRQDSARITIRRSIPATAVGGELVRLTGDYGDENEFGDAEPSHIDIAVQDDEPETVTVIAPLVGRFRHIKPLVGLGARVEQGQVVCEIWAMNIANEVTSPAGGKVIDLLADDGQPVEYGQELFVIQTQD